MIPADDRSEIRRILVALDTSPHSVAALKAAIQLADEWGADLVGLFVEDLNLLRLAQLPFAHEVSAYSARVRAIGPDRLERQLRAQATRLRKQMARLAMRRGIRYSFEVSRGDIAAELLEQAESADLVILGKTGWSESRTMGSTTRLIVTRARGRVLIIRREGRLAPSLRVIYDGSDAAERALRSAAMLAEREDRELSVLLIAETEAGVSKLRKEAADLLRERGQAARYRALIAPDPTELAESVAALDCVLVLPADIEGLAGEEMLAFLDQVECPVLVVR